MKQGTWTQKSDGSIELKESKSSGGGPATPLEAAIFFVVVGLIIAFIVGFVHLYNNAHSPKTINVDLVSITTEYVPSKSPYSNGTRYVYLEFELESKKREVNEINLYLNVSDSTGKDLGCLDVSFNRLGLAKGETQVIKLSLDDDNLYWGDEKVFEALYNTDFSELTFDYEIWRIDYANDYTWTK